MEWSEESLRVRSLVEQGESLFITGKAGTGKTTLLKEIRSSLEGQKLVAVLAPTGVAAENAQGYTIHSFLRLPLTPYLPKHKVDPVVRLSPYTEEVIRKLDIIIIDEISMVRCDIIDEIDSVLRHFRGKDIPFGGIQIIMFGDLFQLCPVATRKEEKTLLEHYKTLYFFGSYALQEMKYRIVELTHVYRQDEMAFISLLNNIREATVNQSDLDLLDTLVDERFRPDVYSDVVTLMTHRRMANRHNDEQLKKIETDVKVYTGHYDNWEGIFPVRKKLELKIGSRVMFQRNDYTGHLFRNGTLGRVVEMYDEYVIVEKDNGQRVHLEPYTWEQLDYHIDKKKKVIYTEVTGSYTQLPLKLAWAVSIHKSQGLTFDEVCIDAEHSFTFGQVYVALSRCRKLEGIHLLSPIMYQKIMVDDIIKNFILNIDSEGLISNFDFLNKEQELSEPIQLIVESEEFWRIMTGKKKNFKVHVRDIETAKKVFKYDGESICVNPVFRNKKESWTYYDINGGNCPFILINHNRASFVCNGTTQTLVMKIEGVPSIELKYGFWEYSFRVGDKIHLSL